MCGFRLKNIHISIIKQSCSLCTKQYRKEENKEVYTPVTARKLNEKADTKPKQSEKSFPKGFSVFSARMGGKVNRRLGKLLSLCRQCFSLNFPPASTSCRSSNNFPCQPRLSGKLSKTFLPSVVFSVLCINNSLEQRNQIQ